MLPDVSSPSAANAGSGFHRGSWQRRARHRAGVALSVYRSPFAVPVLMTAARAAGYAQGRLAARKRSSEEGPPAQEVERGLGGESRGARRQRIRSALRAHPAYYRTVVIRKAARVAMFVGAAVGAKGLAAALQDANVAQQTGDTAMRDAARLKAWRAGRVERGVGDAAIAVGVVGAYYAGRIAGDTHDVRRAR